MLHPMERSITLICSHLLSHSHSFFILLITGSYSLHTLTFLSALMRRGCTLMLSLATGTVVLGVMVAALLGEVEMMA